MKEFIKKYMPKFIVNFVKFCSFKLQLQRDYSRDYKRYSHYAFENPINNNEVQFKAKIALYAHTLEKGLSHINPRLGFGKSTVIKLIEVMKLYIKRKFPKEDTRFRSGLSVLKSYFELHKNNNNHIQDILLLMAKEPELLYEIESVSKKYGGSITINKKDTCISENDTFFDILNKRVSVRNYSSCEIDNQKLMKAIEIAVRTPSACNRQPWQVYIIRTNEILIKTLKLQSGFNSYGDNLKNLILVTSSNAYYSTPKERNASYIDGGMFAMTLVYSLHSQGFATSVLNATLNRKKDNAIRVLLNIPKSDSLICFIALGNYPDTISVPISYRVAGSEIINYR